MNLSQKDRPWSGNIDFQVKKRFQLQLSVKKVMIDNLQEHEKTHHYRFP